jgi:hypothetical protein
LTSVQTKSKTQQPIQNVEKKVEPEPQTQTQTKTTTKRPKSQEIDPITATFQNCELILNLLTVKTNDPDGINLTEHLKNLLKNVKTVKSVVSEEQAEQLTIQTKEIVELGITFCVAFVLFCFVCCYLFFFVLVFLLFFLSKNK